jgi:hypothetical protein
MPSLTLFTEGVAAAPLELDSANLFCPRSSQVLGRLAEELLHEERDELRWERSELMVLWLPTGVDEVPRRTL